MLLKEYLFSKDNLFDKDNIIQNLFIFVLLLIGINNLNITIKHIYSFIIVIMLCYIYFYIKDEHYKNILEEKEFIQNLIGDNHFDGHNLFIEFIYKNKRFEKVKNFKEFINSINLFLKYSNSLNNNFEPQKLDNCIDLYKNALNNYQSLIYLLSTIDDNFQNDIYELERIFKSYIDIIKTIKKDNYDENNIHNKMKLNDEYLISGKDKIDTFTYF